MWTTILLGMLMQQPAAPAVQNACPATIQVSQQAIKPPAGWSADTETGTHKLANVALYDGPPKEQASLIPTTDTKQIATWVLRPNPRGYYLECLYEGTEVKLSRKVGADAKQCQLVLGSKAVTAECR